MSEPIPPATTARTGESCPRAGLWQVEGQPAATACMEQGHIVPPWQGRTVTWRLVHPK